MVNTFADAADYKITNLFNQKYPNDPLDHHRLPVPPSHPSLVRSDTRSSFVPHFNYSGSGELDFFVHGYPAVARGTDVPEGLVVQFAVDRKHEDIIDWCHGLDTPESVGGRDAGSPPMWYSPCEQPSLEVECTADDGNGIGVGIPAVLSRGGVHGNKFLQL